MQELISVIMPTYNRGYIISSAIDSVLSQTYKFWEFIIVDDGSTDETEHVINEYRHDDRIKYFKLDRNHGANYCRNYGAKNAKGRYLAFIDSDVVWKNNKIERQLNCLRENSDCDLVFCKTMLIKNNKAIEFPKRDEHHVLEPNSLKYGNFIDTNTVLIKKEIVLNCGGFDENLPRLQEWELFIRLIMKQTHKFFYMDEHLCDNYIQNDSISMDSSKYNAAMDYIINKHNDIFLSTDLNSFVKNNVNTDLSSFLSQNDKAYIYGAGYYGKFLKDYIKENYGVETAFVVTDSGTDETVLGIMQLDKSAPIIIGVNKNLSEEIKETLINNGYNNWINGFEWNY